MTRTTEWLVENFYDNEKHPYRIYERIAASLLGPQTTAILDAGCGRSAPVLRKLAAPGRRLVGIDLVDPADVPAGIEYHKGDLATMPLEDNSIDLIISRSVFEHLEKPLEVYREMSRVLKPGGRVLFLTANIYDYGTFISRLTPNRFHSKVVKMVEGRKEDDTFPTMYRTNSRGVIKSLCAESGMRVEKFEYMNQYPNYFNFNAILFVLGMIYERITTHVPFLRFLSGWIMVTLVKEGGQLRR